MSTEYVILYRRVGDIDYTLAPGTTSGISIDIARTAFLEGLQDGELEEALDGDGVEVRPVAARYWPAEVKPSRYKRVLDA